MNIGLIDVDGHHYPNHALMKVSAYHKSKGDNVEWANIFEKYDIVYSSKIFTFSPDFDYSGIRTNILLKGGTGYDIGLKLPEEIESINLLDYSIYPMYNFSIQFFSRGCIRKCSFCVVKDKEGSIRKVDPCNLNPKGKWIEVLDNNFFANPDWRSSVEYLINSKQPVNMRGVDIRILNEEQAYYLNKMKLKSPISIAWDDPKIDLTTNINNALKYINKNKMQCYVLIGYNSTIKEDLFRVNTLKELGINPFVMIYRDYNNEHKPTQYQKDFARWANRRELFKTCSFDEFIPRKGFKCVDYLR